MFFALFSLLLSGAFASACDEVDNYAVDGYEDCCPASRTKWNSDYSKALECCKTDIVNFDGSCSDDPVPVTGTCKGEIESKDEDCDAFKNKEDCEKAFASPFSDGLCDWEPMDPDSCMSKVGKVCADDPACEWKHSTKTCSDKIDNCTLKTGRVCADDDSCVWRHVTKTCLKKEGDCNLKRGKSCKEDPTCVWRNARNTCLKARGDCAVKKGKVCKADPTCIWRHGSQKCLNKQGDCDQKAGKVCKDDPTCEWHSNTKECEDLSAICGGDGCCQFGKPKGVPIDQDPPNKLLRKPQANEFDCAASCVTKPDPADCKWWTYDTTNKECTLLRDSRLKNAGPPLGVSNDRTRYVSGPLSCKPVQA